MESIKYNPLIIITEEELFTIRTEYNMNDIRKINDCVDMIMEWYKKQEHLTQKPLDRGFIERMLMISRGSVEKTKAKVDKFFTLRGMMPELMMNREIEEFQELFKVVNYTPLPKLSPDYTRVMVTTFTADNINQFSTLAYFRYCFMLGDYRMYHDYSNGETFIIDLNNIPISILTKINPIIIKKAEIMCHEGYGSKVKGIHVINAPSYVDKFIILLKQGLKEKVAKRIYVHKSYEELHKTIPKTILPSDYGGDECTVKKLTELWIEELKTKNAREILSELDTMISNESNRQSVKFNEEYMGMPGSFKKLTVD